MMRAKHVKLFAIQVRAPVLLAASEATMFHAEDDMLGGADFNASVTWMVRDSVGSAANRPARRGAVSS
jgi:hypothetical protein